jgi:cytochrome c oxidase cbb3-type subunit 3
MSEDKENLTGHNYDGIEEYDNPLPRWWMILFLGTIIFAFMYWLHYQIGSGTGQLAELKQDLDDIKTTAGSQAIVHSAPETEADLQKLLADPSVALSGKAIFQSKCVACHGNDLQGIVGPNLTDDYWIHGKGHLTEILAVVRAGVLEKGMPAWETMLKDDEIKSVVIYIKKNHGANPANPKAPQGEKSDVL